MKTKTTKILGRPIDAFEAVVPGYLITIDGQIWTRLHTRGLGKEWKSATGSPDPAGRPRSWRCWSPGRSVPASCRWRD